MLHSRTGRAALFLILACGGAWSLVWSFARGGGHWDQPIGRFVFVLHMFPVALAALLVQGPILRQPLKVPLGVGTDANLFWAVGWLLPVGVLAAALGAAALWPGIEVAIDPDALGGLVGGALVAGLTFNLLATLAEEVGWRGFLWKEVAGGFWTRATVIGLCWGVYMAPAVATGMIYPGRPVTGVVLVILWCVLVTPLALWVRLRGGSILAAAAFRGTLMALTNVAFTLTRSDEPLVAPLYGATGLVGVVVVLLGVLAYERFVAEDPILVAKRR